MKDIFRTLPVIAVMTTVAACSGGIEEQNPNGPATGDKIRIEFTAENPGTGIGPTPAAETRTSIHIGDGSFVSRWDDGNEMTLLYGSTAAKATYSSATKKFATEITPGTQDFHAFSPHVENSYAGSVFTIPFGNLRTQDGNNFNHRYDPLITTAARTADPASDELVFTLKRLTSILKFEISGGSDPVKALLLTAGENHPVSSSGFIGATDGTGGIDTSVQNGIPAASNVIAMTFAEGTAPTTAGLHAYFNLPEGQYESLKLDIITENGQIGSIDLAGLPAFEAGELYRLKKTGAPAFAPIEKPSLDWPGQDMDIPHEIIDEDGDMVLDYPAAITINAPAGIAQLYVDVVSPALNALEIGRLDLFNETQLPIGINYSDLGLNCTTQIQYQKSTLFDITRLVPMIPLLKDGLGSLVYGDHTFNVTVVDLAGNTETRPLTFRCNRVECSASDLWANTGTLSIYAVDPQARSVVVKYRAEDASAWHELTASAVDAANGTWKADITADNVWSQETNPSGLTIYIPDSDAGIFAQKNYEYELLVDGSLLETGKFAPENNGGDIIPNGDMESSSLPCYTENDSATTSFWGSGNNSFAKTLCSRSTFKGMGGSSCAKLEATLAGVLIWKYLAAGNLFSATFEKPSTTGFVRFGQNYTYTARPTALKLKYHAQIGKVDQNTHGGPLKTGEQDKARIFVCIIDWDQQHEVTSGTNAPTGIWDPEMTIDPGEGKIIGYGSLFIEGNTEGDSMIETELKINYYDKVTKPSKAYKLIISCATSAYGDYMNGCSTNVMYIDDFAWVY